MYEQYLQLSNIPCGAVLNRIMTKEGISQSQLAERSGIVANVFVIILQTVDASQLRHR